jgi:hypothetical protein
MAIDAALLEMREDGRERREAFTIAHRLGSGVRKSVIPLQFWNSRAILFYDAGA